MRKINGRERGDHSKTSYNSIFSIILSNFILFFVSQNQQDQCVGQVAQLVNDYQQKKIDYVTFWNKIKSIMVDSDSPTASK